MIWLLSGLLLFFFGGGGHNSPPLSHGLLIHEVSRSHNDAPHLVGLLWTSDQPVAGEQLHTYGLDRAVTGFTVLQFKIRICRLGFEVKSSDYCPHLGHARYKQGSHLFTPCSRVLLEKLTSKLCS